MAYCNPELLRQLIRRAQLEGVASADLCTLVARIADGIWQTAQWLDRDDFTQDVVLLFLQKLNQIDTERAAREVFSYLTCIATSLAMQRGRSGSSERRKLVRYSEWLGEDVPLAEKGRGR